MDLGETFQKLVEKPLEVIQSVKATTLALFGLYLLSPFYIPSNPSSSQNAFNNSITFRFFFCLVFFVLPALPTFLGWFMARFRTDEWRSRGCFYMFIGVTTLTLLRIIAVGVFPPIWLFYFASGLTSAVLYLHWKMRE
jgi:hypothetical protein